MTPKILILCMTCNKPEFKGNEKAISETYAKRILDGNVANVDFYFYTSGKQNRINTKTHRITVTSGDNVNSTFDKTKKCIELLDKKGIEYDYIVRINTSTYVNVTFLINYIFFAYNTNTLRDKILCTTLVKQNNNIFPCGKLIVFNKDHVNKIIDYQGDTNKPDDVVYGDIFSPVDNNYTENIYKSISMPLYYNWIENFYYSCSVYSEEVLKKYIYMSVRDINDNRNNEIAAFYKIHEILSNYKTNYDDFMSIFTSNIVLFIDDNNTILIKKLIAQ